MSKVSELTPENRQEADRLLANLRWNVDSVLSQFDQVINLPGMPSKELTILKEQRSKMGRTSGVILGVKARLDKAGQ